MREIKFRAKSTETKLHTVRWRFGSLLTPPNEACKPLIYERFSRPMHDGNGYWYEVEADTVGQFTGLKDHKGREIYEGDIVKVVDDGEESFHVVEYMSNEDYPAFDLVPGLNVDSNGLAYCEHYTDYDVKMYVIGNIHDNPELLRLTKTGGLEK